MKKFLLLILTFAYLASSSGATLYIHECMGKTIGWDVNIESGSSCGGCGMHQNVPKDCCKDHVKVLKSNSDQNVPGNSYDKIVLVNFVLPGTQYQDFKPRFQNVKHDSSERFIFPRSKINYCVLFCTFLI